MASRNQPDDLSSRAVAMHGFAGVNSQESFSQPTLSGKQRYFDEKPAEVFLRNEHSFNQIIGANYENQPTAYHCS